MPPYTTHELRTREEMDAVVDVIWKAQYTPYMPSASIFFPIFGYSDEARKAAIEASKQRLWESHCSNPSSHWIYVLDTKTEQIIGGTQWEWHDSNPFSDGIAKINCHWWPKGEARSLCEEFLRQAYTPRTIWMQQPHASLNMMVVLPEHRGRGAGGLMMQWGNDKIDEQGMESFIEASELGRGLYEKWGYTTVMKLDFYLPSKPSDSVKKWAHELKMPPWYAMWRPSGGQVKEGERNRPWQLVPPLKPKKSAGED